MLARKQVLHARIETSTFVAQNLNGTSGRISVVRRKALRSVLCVGAALAGASLLVGASSVAGQERQTSAPLVQIRDGRTGDVLVRLRPRTLRQIGRPIRTFRSGDWPVFSPDGRTLAYTDASGGRSRIQFVDAARWRSLGLARLGRQGMLGAGWLSNDRLLAFSTWGPGPRRLLVVDSSRRRVVARRAFSGFVMNSLAVPGGFALMLEPRHGIGPVRILLVDPAGGVRTFQLDGIRAGGADREPYGLDLNPGLTADPAGGRLYVVAARGLRVAQIELASGAVSYHTVDAGAASANLDGRAATGDVGARAAKGNIDVWSRSAAWIGDGRFAVTGDHYPPVRGRQPPSGPLPFGIRIVDTSDWSIDTLDPRPDLVQVAGATVLAYGTRWFGDPPRPESTGLLAFEGAGQRAWTRFRGKDLAIAVSRGHLAYVWIRRTRTMHVIDVRDGRTVSVVRGRRHLPFLLTP
jgi:WD40-like Beta Propeller Repeat